MRMQAAPCPPARAARPHHPTRSTTSRHGTSYRMMYESLLRRDMWRASAVAAPVDTVAADVSTGIQEVEAAKEQIDWRQQWCAYRGTYPPGIFA